MCCNSSEIACRALLGVFLLDILMSGLVLFCIATVISFIAIGWGTWGKNRSHNNALQFPTRLSSLSLNLTWKKNWTVLEIENCIISASLLQPSWFYSNFKYSWGGYFDQVSYWLGKNYEFFNQSQFLWLSDFFIISPLCFGSNNLG